MSNSDHQHREREPLDEQIVQQDEPGSLPEADAPIRNAWLMIRKRIGRAFTTATDDTFGRPESRGGKKGHPEKIRARMMTRRGALGTLATTLGGIAAWNGIDYLFGGSNSSTENQKTTPTASTAAPQGTESALTEKDFGPLDDPTTGTNIFLAIVGQSSREQWVRPATVHLMLKTVHEMCERWRSAQKKSGLSPKETAEKSATGRKIDATKALLRVSDAHMTPGVGADATPEQMQEFDALTDRLVELETKLGELTGKEKERKPHMALQIEEEAMPTAAMCAEGILALWDAYEFLKRGSVRKILRDVPYAIIRIIEHYIMWGFLSRATAKEGTTAKEVEKGMKFARAALIATLASTAVGGVAISNLWPTSKMEDRPAAAKPAEVSAAQRREQASPPQESQGAMVPPDDPEHPVNLRVDIREQEIPPQKPDTQPAVASKKDGLATGQGTIDDGKPNQSTEQKKKGAQRQVGGKIERKK